MAMRVAPTRIFILDEAPFASQNFAPVIETEEGVACRNNQDRISIVGVKIYPRIGITPEERSNPQECEADLTVWSNFQAAAAEDSLEKSVDYTKLVERAKATAVSCEYNLLETLAYRLVRDLLESFPVARVCVKLRKRPATLVGEIDFIEVEVAESVPTRS
jgi:dihydroneopterin aldolase